MLRSRTKEKKDRYFRYKKANNRRIESHISCIRTKLNYDVILLLLIIVSLFKLTNKTFDTVKNYASCNIKVI